MYSKEKDEVIKKDKIKKSEILLKLFGVTGLAIIFLALYDFFIAKDKEILTEDFLLVLSLAPLMTSHLMLFIIIIPKFVKRIKKKLKINFVNSTTDFENVFEQLKQKYSEMLIKERNKTIFKSWGIFLWTISLIAFYIFFYMELAKFSEMNSSNWIYILCVYIIGLSLLVFAIYGFIKLWIKKQEIIEEYSIKYKSTILSGILTCVEPNSRYESKGCITEEEYRKSNIENKEFSDFESKDSMTMWNEKIKINELLIKNSRYVENKKYIDKVFEGIFVIFEIDKEIKDTIEIRNQKIKSKIKEGFITMNSQDFEDSFKVYSNNEELAKAVLNEKIIKIITDCYEKYKLKFDLVFNKEKIYIRIYTGEIFEPVVYERIPNKERTLRHYTFIKCIKELCMALEENI